MKLEYVRDITSSSTETANAERQQQQQLLLGKSPTRGTANANARGGQSMGDAVRRNPERNKNNNIFAGISEFFAGFGKNKDSGAGTCDQVRVATDTIHNTPVTAAGSANSSLLDEGPAEENHDDAAALGHRWNSDSDFVVCARGDENPSPAARSQPVAINNAGSGRRTAWHATASPSDGGRGCEGRGAGDPEDEGGGMGEEEGNSDVGDRMKEWRRTCASKRVSFTVRVQMTRVLRK